MSCGRFRAQVDNPLTGTKPQKHDRQGRCRPLRLEARGRAAGFGGLRPEPHDARFDFERTTEGAEWIDALRPRGPRAHRPGRPDGHRASRLARGEPPRFVSAKVVAGLDWDSFGVLSEAELAGGAAYYFTSDFRVEGRRRLPTLEERSPSSTTTRPHAGSSFSEEERKTARASLVNAMAYTARCSAPTRSPTSATVRPLRRRRERSPMSAPERSSPVTPKNYSTGYPRVWPTRLGGRTSA